MLIDFKWPQDSNVDCFNVVGVPMLENQVAKIQL